jgi:hypothetical protein
LEGELHFVVLTPENRLFTFVPGFFLSFLRWNESHECFSEPSMRLEQARLLLFVARPIGGHTSLLPRLVFPHSYFLSFMFFLPPRHHRKERLREATRETSHVGNVLPLGTSTISYLSVRRPSSYHQFDEHRRNSLLPPGRGRRWSLDLVVLSFTSCVWCLVWLC